MIPHSRFDHLLMAQGSRVTSGSGPQEQGAYTVSFNDSKTHRAWYADAGRKAKKRNCG